MEYSTKHKHEQSFQTTWTNLITKYFNISVFQLALNTADDHKWGQFTGFVLPNSSYTRIT